MQDLGTCETYLEQSHIKYHLVIRLINSLIKVPDSKGISQMGSVKSTSRLQIAITEAESLVLDYYMAVNKLKPETDISKSLPNEFTMG